MAEKALVAVFEENGIIVTAEQKDVLVKAISMQSPTDAELRLYFYDCARRGVHPLDRLIHFTKRNGRYTPVVSIDYMRIRAESSNAYAGSDDAKFDEAEPYPRAATVTVWKIVQESRCPFAATARWSEYAPPDMQDKGAFMWRKMPHTMLAKCAESLALRKAFPGQLSGLYSREEMEQAGPVHGEIVDVEPGPVQDPRVESSAAATPSAPGPAPVNGSNGAKKITEPQYWAAVKKAGLDLDAGKAILAECGHDFAAAQAKIEQQHMPPKEV